MNIHDAVANHDRYESGEHIFSKSFNNAIIFK